MALTKKVERDQAEMRKNVVGTLIIIDDEA